MHDSTMSRVRRGVARLKRALPRDWVPAVRRGVDSVFLSANVPPVRVRNGDLRVGGYLQHWQVLELIGGDAYEPYSQSLFEGALVPGCLVFDVGAHVGWYSLVAARRLGGNGAIHAFEPDPYNFRALEFNLAANGFRGVRALRAAVSDHVGTATFFKAAGTVSNSLIARSAKAAEKVLTVDVTSLDAVVPAYGGEPVVLKMDVEGAELFVLRGMRGLLAAAPSVTILTEVDPRSLADAGTSDLAFTDALREQGFQVSFVDEEGQRLIPLLEGAPPSKGNLYCTRSAARG